MTSVIHYGQCLSVCICVIHDLLLILPKYSFEAGVVDVLFREDVYVTKTIMFNVTVEGFYILFDFIKVSETTLNCVTSGVLFHKADSFIIVIAYDEALAHIRGEIGHSFDYACPWCALNLTFSFSCHDKIFS